MKSVIIIFCASLILLLGCAGVHQQSVADVSTHKFSYTKPPSDWKQLFLSDTSMTIGGAKVPVYSSTWIHKNTSSITVLAVDLSGFQEKPTAREITIMGIEQWAGDYLGELCTTTRLNIIDETTEPYKGSSQVFKLTSEVVCEIDGEGESFVTKFQPHAIDHMGSRYRFQFAARDDYYDQDYKVYAELLESIDFL